jgi:FSR family fosmidomycin resistance protein-like MFS transporter
MVIEPLLNLFSNRQDKKIWILGGLSVLALTSLLLGYANSFLMLVLVGMVSYPAGGAGVSLAQAAVIDAAPGESARTMTRWTLLSSIGDLLSPLVVAALVAIGLGWTALCGLSAGIWLLMALLLWPLRFPQRAAQENEEEEEPGMRASLRAALSDPLLLRWCALTIIPSMLDEIFLGFVSLYLRDVFHLGETLIALLLASQMAASFLGLFVLDRLLLRRQPAPVYWLFWLALSTLVGVIMLLCFHMLWVTCLALLLIGASCAGWYPLAHAEAYAMRPDDSGIVRAIIGLGAPLELVMPGVVGLVAASGGILAGLGLLGLAPLLMLALLPYRRGWFTSSEKRSR